MSLFDALNNIARAYFSLGNDEKALELFEKIELYSVVDPNKQIVFLCHKAIVYYELYQKDKCSKLLENAFLIDPDNKYLLL